MILIIGPDEVWDIMWTRTTENLYFTDSVLFHDFLFVGGKFCNHRYAYWNICSINPNGMNIHLTFLRRYSGQEMHWDAFIVKAINFQDPIKGEMSNDQGIPRMSQLTRFFIPGALTLWITRTEWNQHLRQWLHPHRKGKNPPPDISWLSIFPTVRFLPMIFIFSILQKWITN